MELLSLPPEMLARLTSFLFPGDLISLSMTCKLLNRTTESNHLWAAVCKNQFGIDIPSSSNGSAQSFYRNVLKNYGKLLGIWRKPPLSRLDLLSEMVHDHYGGLLQIMYFEGQLCAFDLLPPKDPHLMEPLRPRKLFSISMDAENSKAVVKCFCSKGPIEHDSCELVHQSNSVCSDLSMQCSGGKTPYYQGLENFDLEQEMKDWNDWMADQVDQTDMEARARSFSHFLLKKEDVDAYSFEMTRSTYIRLRLPSKCDFPVPIQPGLFKGWYHGCGIQLIVLSYENQHTATGLKITGDIYNRAGNKTFTADIKSAMHLTGEAQSTTELIKRIKVSSSGLDWNDLPSPQSFIFPEDCEGRYLIDITPKECKARFHGSGRLNARYADDDVEGTATEEINEGSGHWVVFNEDLFGFLWIEPRQFSLFHRVQNPLLLQ